jgi:hypothetical protein
MTHRFAVTLVDGQTCDVEADEATTRADGSAWFLQALRPPPAALEAVVGFARGQWLRAVRDDASVVFVTATRGSQQTPEQKPQRLLPATDIPDRAGW